MTKLLVRNIEYLADQGGVRQGDIAIDGATIAQIGAVGADWRPDQTIDGTGKLAIPGLINTHTHAAMSLFRSYADDMLLMDWLKTRIWPAEAKLTAGDVYWGSQLAIAEMIKSGTTTFADMYFFMSEVAKAVTETGIRAVLARGMAGVAPTAQQALAESEALFEEFHGSADGRITVMLGPHAPYTCPPDFLTKVVALARKLGAEIHIHLAETAGEVAECQTAYGKSPIALMDEVGLLDCGVLAAHCVHVSPEDIRIMKNKQVRIAHNPGSNMKLASGIAPVPQMLEAGLTVGLGTDSAASNNNLDMLEEIRLTALLHKMHSNDPLAIPAGTAVELATTGGAEAIGLGKITGKLAPGYKADIVLLDMSGLHWYPRHDRLSLLAYSAAGSDVHTVIVNGRIVLENKQLKTIDEERLIYEANTRGLRLVR
ncbi:amidohydrolase|uniref:5-methylthioadenosine/S-adenosylhomocysteine deaminase n=1 Tax=Dendrosporobacter quercicolus TaxID=146817 RepID=A0A1G9LZQ0_9FIRM|nr:amidohydrolase [Dendrosporobacter quercicolus]NSL46869.1 amidohydrolase [Dendrosporobacter quercicolus DSM 1736]SDL67500.1 5-methylthioadenosine/S-adenosylhomocysteine deaminase [Dendrosporobacter quercicolus]